MAGSSGNRDEGPISDINVTPLVDIMLVLVIILMITAEFTRYKTVPVNLPKVNAAAMKQEPQRIALTIKKDGILFFNEKPVTDLSELPSRLREAKSAHPEIAVILRSEGEIPYAKILAVLDQVKNAGISKVGLAVDANSKIKQ